MKAEHGTRTDLQRFWQRLTESEQEILAYFAFARPPVSVDTLTSFSGSSAVTVLALMERLRGKRLVCERKEVGKGFYFPQDPEFMEFVRGLRDEHMKAIGRKIIDHHIRSHPEGEEETVFLADLYLNLGSPGERLDVVKNAADILRRSGQRRKAWGLYDHIITSLWEDPLKTDQAQLLVDTIVDKTDRDDASNTGPRTGQTLDKSREDCQREGYVGPPGPDRTLVGQGIPGLRKIQASCEPYQRVHSPLRKDRGKDAIEGGVPLDG